MSNRDLPCYSFGLALLSIGVPTLQGKSAVSHAYQRRLFHAADIGSNAMIAAAVSNASIAADICSHAMLAAAGSNAKFAAALNTFILILRCLPTIISTHF